MCRRGVSVSRKSSDFFLTLKIFIFKGVSDVNDAPTSAVSPRKRQLFLSILNQAAKSRVSQINSQYPRGHKTKCVKVFLFIIYFDQQFFDFCFHDLTLTPIITNFHDAISERTLTFLRFSFRSPILVFFLKKQLMYKKAIQRTLVRSFTRLL